MDAVGTRRTGDRWLVAVFVGALLLHVWLVSFNLRMPFLSGHEFRQSQTALITYYIDRDSDFSPFYEQPIFGKPWVSFILEYPLYQWCVVGLSRMTELPHHVAARLVSIVCFYLALPAMFLALGRLDLDRARRLLVLAFVLVCPVYVFYTRAFLIDPMATMFSAWFLAGFLRTMDRRHVGWLAVTVFAGVAAALVKNVILAVWMLPAAAYGAWMLWRDVRARQGWRRPVLTLAWGLATVAPLLLAMRWWVKATDALKEANPSTTIFTSAALSQDNWGLGRVGKLFSRELWGTLLDRWGEAILQPWVLLALLVAAPLLVPRHRGKLLGLTAVFFLAQLLFPYAYAWQDYYFYSCAAFAVAALGLLAVGLWDSRLPRWLGAALVLLLLAGPVGTYWGNYRQQQAAVSFGSNAFTDTIRDLTPPGSVLVVAGHDWAAMIPYYSERRALMVRNGLEYDLAYLGRAFKTVEDELVHTMVVGSGVRANRRFLDFATGALDLDPVPVFSSSWGDVYVSRFYLADVLRWIERSRNRFSPETVFPERTRTERRALRVPPDEQTRSFAMMEPGPVEIDFEYGYSVIDHGGRPALPAHSDSLMWVAPPARARSIEMEFGVVDAAWRRDGPGTNGIEFVIFVEEPGQQKPRAIYRRLLDPARVEGDRGLQRARVDYTPKTGERVCFAALSNGSKAFDWGYWAGVRFR
jgi:hypothetical protein